MLTFNELRPILFGVAKRYVNNRYEIWELVNAVWAIGNVQKLPTIKFAIKRVKYDIIDYIRQDIKTRTKRPVAFSGAIKWYRGELAYSDSEKTVSSESIITINSLLQPEQIVESDDMFDWMMKGLSSDKKLLLKLMYKSGLSQEETARTIGLSPGRISQLHSNAIAQVKAKLQGKDFIKMFRRCSEEHYSLKETPEKRYHRFYNNRYYHRVIKHRIRSAENVRETIPESCS